MVMTLFVARILSIHRATGGWTIRALTGDQQIPQEFTAHRASLDVAIPTWEWMVSGSQTVIVG